jgi:hypothetical protein
MVEISRFLEMKIEAEAFKVYTNSSCHVSDHFKAEGCKAFPARNGGAMNLSATFLEVYQSP